MTSQASDDTRNSTTRQEAKHNMIKQTGYTHTHVQKQDTHNFQKYMLCSGTALRMHAKPAGPLSGTQMQKKIM